MVASTPRVFAATNESMRGSGADAMPSACPGGVRSHSESCGRRDAGGCQTRAVQPWRLLLIRHAQAADGPVDIDRPLTAQGRRQAEDLGRWLEQAGLAPGAVLVSPARRAQQTWEQAAAALEPAPTPTVDARILDNT